MKSKERYSTGADPGIYVSRGALDGRGVWGPPSSLAVPGQRPVGGHRGENPRKLMRIRNLRRQWKRKNGCILGVFCSV